MEFPLDFVYYLYNYYMVCALLPHTHHVTFLYFFISPKEKEKKRNINNDLAVLPSHNTSGK